ncbi:MAG: ABC transporter permease [Cryomorphaceae bacterium]|nr:ABC transporter permease [Cryomorphaceae bacterium]
MISRQKKTAVSVISWIAVLGMLVSSAAMVILLSAFNGIEGMIEGMYTAFDQEVTMTPKNGSKISADSLRKVLSLTKNIEGVNAQSMFIQERIIIRKEKKWANAELWAVEPSFFEMANVNTPEHLINGNPLTGSGQALMGVGLANKLGLHSMDLSPETAVLYIPRQDRKIRIGKSPFFQQRISVSGAIEYNKELNDQVLLVPLSYATGFFSNEVSGVLMSTAETKRNSIKKTLVEKFGGQFSIKTNLEKNALIFKTSKSEKLIVVIILIFVFILSLFNLSASLTMTYLEKKAEFTTMFSLGMSSLDLSRIFLVLGAMIVSLGVFIGLSAGSLLVFLHEQLHLIKIPGTTNAFPSNYDGLQIIYLLFLLIILGFTATAVTTSFLMKTNRKV